MRRPSEDDTDFPVIVSLQPLHLPFERVPDRVGVVCVGDFGGTGSFGCVGDFERTDCLGCVGDFGGIDCLGCVGEFGGIDCLGCVGDFGAVGCFGCIGVGVGSTSFLSAINDTPPRLIEGSVGESGLNNAAGM